MSSLQYRRDIDGLRAMAILPVLLFHAGFEVFSGGYIGVDVFFVISGYLITSIIVREIEQERFSFSNFWARRARRILPAALVMVLATLTVGWFTLAPEDYLELGRSARAQAVFSANFIFWEGDGYFAGPSELKPLLHTWSLAIEEQFYFVFPLVYMLAWRLFPKHRRLFLILLFITSLLASIVLVQPHPSATFYLLHTRAWELLLGSLLAVSISAKHPAPGICQGVSVAGLFAISLPIFLYDEQTAFPGAAALPPTLGTAAIIWANSYHRTWVSQLLSLRLFVGIGLISYSLYLWHWPLMAFNRYLSVEEPALIEKVILVAISFFLAALSYKLVETPLRQKKLFPSNKAILTGAAISIIAVAAIGQQIRRGEGYPARLPQEALNFAIADERTNDQKRCYLLEADTIRENGPCRFGPAEAGDPAVLLWGDSHATALLPALKIKAAELEIGITHAAKSLCAPMTRNSSQTEQCNDFNESMINFALEHGIEHVLLAARWSIYSRGEDDESRYGILKPNANDVGEPAVAERLLSENLTTLVEQLTERNIQVWLFKQVPWHEGHNVSQELTQLAIKGMDTGTIRLDRDVHEDRHIFANQLLEQMATHDLVHLIDPTPWLCDEKHCFTARNGYSLYRDDDHLSVQGAEMIADILDPIFEAAKPD